MLVLGAVTELTRLHFPHNKALLDDLQILQKRLKYGLARTAAIALYELGFADRVLASELAAVVGPVESRAAARQAIRHHEGAIRQALAQYPSYFSDILRTLPDYERRASSNSDSASSAPLGKANPMTIHQLHHFLQGIHHKIQEQDKLAAATGENFNVFKILGVEAYEVGTHSAFLSELLSPQGTHGQGSTFLKLFLHHYQPQRMPPSPGS